ncbi:MAG: hypothetical protein WED09_11915 [Homoserinimonas sp.]
MTFSKHTYTATVDVAGVPTELIPLRGSLTIDEGWAPYIQADITVAVDAAAYTALDPREDARVELTLTQEFSDNGVLTPGTTVTVDLGVRRRTRTPEGDVQLELAGDEALAQDRAHLGPWMERTYGEVALLIIDYLVPIGAELTSPWPFASLEEPDQSIFPGDIIWDVLTPVIEQSGLRLFVDTAREWKLAQVPLNHPQSISLGSVPVLQETTDTVSRDDESWADSVVVKYDWTDAAGEAHSETDIAWTGSAPSKTKVIERGFAYPGAGAAQHVLNRAQARGRSIDSVAVSNYSVRPGMQLTLPVSDGFLSGRVAAVTWSLDDDRMTITPRDLELAHEFAWVLLAPGESWADSAPGIPWTTP